MMLSTVTVSLNVFWIEVMISLISGNFFSTILMIDPGMT